MFLPDRDDIDSLDIQNILEQVTGNLLFVFDEYDSICNEDVRAKFADTIKNLSDNAPNVTIGRSEEHTSELQSLMRISYAVFCLKKQKHNKSTLIQSIIYILTH